MLKCKPSSEDECAYRAGALYFLFSGRDEMANMVAELLGHSISDDELQRFNRFCVGLKDYALQNKDTFMQAERIGGLVNIERSLAELFHEPLSKEHVQLSDAFLTGLCRSCIKYPFFAGNISRFPCRECSPQLQVQCYTST